MARSFDNYSPPLAYDLSESEWKWLNEIIETVQTCCQMIDINILFSGIFYVILPQDADVGFSEEINDAINRICDYCCDTDSMIWITRDFLYISRNVTDFTN